MNDRGNSCRGRLVLLPRLGQTALQDQGNVRNTLRANVAEKLADIWLTAHLRGKVTRKERVDAYKCDKKKYTVTLTQKYRITLTS